MLGEGVGGAYINASAIRNGVHNRGCEFGHMVIHPGGKQCLCGKKGCFEAYVSEKVLSSELDMTLDNFFELAVQGNKNNSNVLDEYMDNLALGINNIYTMMDCDIVLGGTVAPYLKQYENSIKERLVNDYSFDTDADYLRISDGGGRKSGLGAALSFVARFIDGVE